MLYNSSIPECNLAIPINDCNTCTWSRYFVDAVDCRVLCDWKIDKRQMKWEIVGLREIERDREKKWNCTIVYYQHTVYIQCSINDIDIHTIPFANTKTIFDLVNFILYVYECTNNIKERLKPFSRRYAELRFAANSRN